MSGFIFDQNSVPASTAEDLITGELVTIESSRESSGTGSQHGVRLILSKSQLGVK